MFWLLADWFFIVFHALIILINLFGWLHPSTRKLQIFVLLSTLISWLLMGYFYGWGYCFLTDWHWQVLAKLGEKPAVASYIQYLLLRFFNWSVSSHAADIITTMGLAFGLTMAIIYKVKQLKASKKA